MEKELVELLDDKIQMFHEVEDTLDKYVPGEIREHIMDLMCELANTQKHIDRIVFQQQREE